MLKLVLRRLLLAIPLLLAVSFVLFLLMELIPGDPAATIAGDQATASILAQIREELGLDSPVIVRYIDWLGDAIHGDLGTSLFNSQPVIESIKDRLPATLSLTLAGTAIAIVVGVPAGIVAAQRPGSVLDRAVIGVTSVGLAVPGFWLGLILIVIFVHELAWFPPTGYVPLTEDPVEWLRSIAMPAMALGIPSAAVLARQTRSALFDVLQRDYVRAARARGAGRASVLLRHGMKNAAAPVITVLGFEVLAMLGGSIIIEQLFAVPGFGALAYDAVQTRDLTVIQGVVMVTAVLVVLVNLVVDVLYAYANPRAATGVTATAAITDAVGDEAVTTEVLAGSSLWRRLRRDPVVVASLVFLLAVVVAAVFAPQLAPYDPIENDLRNALQGPGADHLLGTDELGRDVLSRILYGARLSLVASLLAVVIAIAIGFPLGLLAGFRGGRLDAVTMRISDGLMALPGLIVILAIISVFGNSLVKAMVALGVVLAPTFLRLTRGVALNVRTEPYIDAVRVLGLPSTRILRRHVLPHVAPSLIVHTSLMLGVALLVEAGLSYVGLGIQPPDASWGAMLTKASASLRRQPFVIFPPGLAIVLTVLALNLVGDAVRDAVGRVERPTVHRRSARRRPAASAEPVDPTAVLELRDLVVGFPIGGRMTPVVDGVSLTVHRGEVVGLVGESGCGKTVTALATIGLVDAPGQVLAGSVRVDGVELVGRSERELRRLRGDTVAMVFQDPASSLDPAQTVGDQIGESLRVHRGLSRREATARAVELLGHVGITDAVSRVRAYPHEFSGGMAQRVAIASALACDPRLLIADEPTTALDVTVQAEILDLLRRLQAEREMAVVIVTHDLGVVADLCQRAVVMYAGEVVETGTVEDLFADPRHPYTRALLAALPRNEHKGGRLPVIPGKVPQPGAWGEGCHFAERCPHATAVCRERPVGWRAPSATDGRSAASAPTSWWVT